MVARNSLRTVLRLCYRANHAESGKQYEHEAKTFANQRSPHSANGTVRFHDPPRRMPSDSEHISAMSTHGAFTQNLLNSQERICKPKKTLANELLLEYQDRKSTRLNSSHQIIS